MSAIHVLLADSQRLYRDGLSALMSMWPEFKVVGEVSTGEQAIEFCRNNTVNMVLIDALIPRMDGIAVGLVIRRENPAVKVVIVTVATDKELIVKAVEANLNGYLLKDTSAVQLKAQLLEVAQGGVVFSGRPGSTVASEFRRRGRKGGTLYDFESVRDTLSEDDVSLLRLLVQGYSNEEIAERLYVSTGTVKKQLSILMQNNQLTNRVQLAVFAVKCGVDMTPVNTL